MQLLQSALILAAIASISVAVPVQSETNLQALQQSQAKNGAALTSELTDNQAEGQGWNRDRDGGRGRGRGGRGRGGRGRGRDCRWDRDCWTHSEAKSEEEVTSGTDEQLENLRKRETEDANSADKIN